MAIERIDNARGVTLLIENTDKKMLQPVVLDGISLNRPRKDGPAKLDFKVMNDSILNFEEGNTVALNVDNTDMFAGYVFTKKRDKEGVISVTAYDQIRYLKNKGVLLYTNTKANDVVTMLAKDLNLQLGDIEDTGYIIPKRNENNTSMLDMIQTALELTLRNTNKMFVLYDDFGKLCLKYTENMDVPILIDEETAQNYSYESTIDKDTYNRIKLFYDNKNTGRRDVYMSIDSKTQELWGILQYCQSLNEKQTANASVMADKLLKHYDQKTRRLSINNAFGDVRVRGGSGIWVRLNLGDILVNHKMRVENVTHKFNDGIHTMDLELVGGLIFE